MLISMKVQQSNEYPNSSNDHKIMLTISFVFRPYIVNDFF